MRNFRDLTNELLEKVKNEQVTHPFANKTLGIRKAKFHKNVSLFYKEDMKNNIFYLITLLTTE
tara:strand:+ start:2474 stop:2662 length:189 start_codon:yes stop_codon:yes gene_type:complete